MDRVFSRTGPLRGRATVPGDKAISHRALILAAMRTGTSHIHGMATGQDVASTAACLATLGARPTSDQDQVAVVGDGWSPRPGMLDCGNSGSTMRMLMGALAGKPGTWQMQGDQSLSQRPMERVAVPLRRMGATVELSGSGTPPVGITGAALRGVDHRLEIASAQVKTAVLLAGLSATGRTSLTEPSPSRDHTERILRWLGAPISWQGDAVEVEGSDDFFAGDGFSIDIPGDISSAAYLIAAALLVPGSNIIIDAVGVNPTRTGSIEVMRRMGADVTVEITSEDPEPTGSVRAAHSDLTATEIRGAEVPITIDEIPLIALLATQAEGTTVIADAAELRVKESDRIAAIASGLTTMGARITQTDDGLIIEGPTRLEGGTADSYGDHRIALTLAVAGLLSDEPLTVSDWGCSSISYPTFEQDLRELAG